MASREVKKAHDRQRLIVHLDRSAASRLASARARWTSSTHRPKTRSARSFASGSRRTSPPTSVSTTRPTFERRCAWQKTMHAAGWLGITWPKEYGGRGAGLIERIIWDEEYAAARAPVLPGSMGLNLVGPTIIHWGTDAQKRRHLPAILDAAEVWCQGFSEPNAGSD